MLTEKFKIEEISEIKNKIQKRTGYYEPFNFVDDVWVDFEKTVKRMNDGDMETINITNPLYFKSTNKQYVFDAKNPDRLKKMLLEKLDEILEGADSLIDAINDLSIKTASEDEREVLIRKVKMTELGIKMGRKNKQTE